MMHILESLLLREGYTYLKMDGTTVVSQRQQTIHKFNNVHDEYLKDYGDR